MYERNLQIHDQKDNKQNIYSWTAMNKANKKKKKKKNDIEIKTHFWHSHCLQFNTPMNTVCYLYKYSPETKKWVMLSCMCKLININCILIICWLGMPKAFICFIIFFFRNIWKMFFFFLYLSWYFRSKGKFYPLIAAGVTCLLPLWCNFIL